MNVTDLGDDLAIVEFWQPVVFDSHKSQTTEDEIGVLLGSPRKLMSPRTSRSVSGDLRVSRNYIGDQTEPADEL